MKTARTCVHENVNSGNSCALSCRQQQILKMIAEDLTSQKIADRLAISKKTVEFHRTDIKARLGVNGVAGMVRYAIRSGLLEP